MAIVKKPTVEEYLSLISGAKVDIYVGKGAKHYSLPKDLLCYYSTYFQRCLNGKFIEATSGKVTLDEDNVQDFEAMLDYMLRGTSDSFKPDGYGQNAKNDCMRFLTYIDKYDVGGASTVVYKYLKMSFSSYAGAKLSASDMQLIYRLTQPGDQLRTLAVKSILVQNRIDAAEFVGLETSLDGYAAELLRLLRSCYGLDSNKYRQIPY